jgi:hypothetical protein
LDQTCSMTSAQSIALLLLQHLRDAYPLLSLLCVSSFIYNEHILKEF